MGKVVFNMSMSLDGFVAGPNDEVDRLFGWYFSGDTELTFPGTEMVFKLSRPSADLLREAAGTIGAIVTGRRTFDLAGAWGGHPPLGVPHFVLTHRAPQEWVKPGSPFTFVTDGIAGAVTQAKQIAGEKDVAVSSASTLQQCLQAGLVDELDIDLVPILLGAGVRLFDHLGTEPVELEQTRVIEGQGVTHLRFRVVK
ncbi:MAG: dihydrofolate reductase family protein [Caldilineaceae bacterium]|nr:dihydrofolate reductase family protein [Caldilineaceae bacterium]